MIEIFLVIEIKKSKIREYRFLYFFNVINNIVYALNPYTRKLTPTKDSYISELYYEDTQRIRSHTKLMVWHD